MNDTEKIDKLRLVLKPVIDWYKEVESEGNRDDSYLYDMTCEIFDDKLRRSDFQTIIEVLK